MNIPIEIIAAVLPLILSAFWTSQYRMWKRIVRTEKHVLILIIMLRDRGFEIPNETDTRTFLKANNL